MWLAFSCVCRVWSGDPSAKPLRDGVWYDTDTPPGLAGLTRAGWSPVFLQSGGGGGEVQALLVYTALSVVFGRLLSVRQMGTTNHILRIDSIIDNHRLKAIVSLWNALPPEGTGGRGRGGRGGGGGLMVCYVFVFYLIGAKRFCFFNSCHTFLLRDMMNLFCWWPIMNAFAGR